MIRNFSDDIKDSEIYTELLAQVAPRDVGLDKTALSREDWLERAEMMLTNAERIDCRAFVSSRVNIILSHKDIQANIKIMSSLGCCQWP